MDKTQKRLVVVGGGIAGSLLVKSLQFSFDITLIDPKEYFEITWASLRAMVEPKFGERSVIFHREYLTKGQIVTSCAVNITDTDVYTIDGQMIPYDYLVIATGHKDPTPETRNERLRQYQEDYDKIKAADSILIVGGGPTGVELAGEIAVDFPKKKVTLVHRGPRLLDFVGQNAATKTLDWMKSKKVDVKLEQTIDLTHIADGCTTYVTSAGEKINADCHFDCTGKPLGSRWLMDTILRDSVDGFGRLQVDEYLHVKGRKNIFAIGDITDIEEMKQGYLAQQHALMVAKNLKKMIRGELDLEMYQTGFELAIVSLGRRDAVIQFPLGTIIGAIPGLLKSRDLFVGRTRKTLGLDANSNLLLGCL